jgi:aminoglycoside phosphotransferase (APT) family kinase protein
MDRYRRMVSEPLETVSCFGPAAHVRAGCAEVAAEISPDWINGLPTIPQHGDLFSGNLLLHHDKWRILDWETYGLIDLPLYDLLTFFLSVLLARGPVPEHWRPSLLARMPALIATYSQRLGLSPADTRRLFPLTLANWFHLQWKDGRQEFATAMYKTIDHYFQSRELWENSILPNSVA